MKSADEIRMGKQRESSELLIEQELGEKALNTIFSFSHLECYVDVKLKEGWIRYALIEGGDEPDKLWRIG